MPKAKQEDESNRRYKRMREIQASFAWRSANIRLSLTKSHCDNLLAYKLARAAGIQHPRSFDQAQRLFSSMYAEAVDVLYIKTARRFINAFFDKTEDGYCFTGRTAEQVRRRDLNVISYKEPISGRSLLDDV